MKQIAFKMKLKKGCESEYARRHSLLWPEMKELLKKSGISNYSIFLDPETSVLYAYQEIEGDHTSQDMGVDPIIKEWWNYMSDIMEVNPDCSPVSIPLKQVFYLA